MATNNSTGQEVTDPFNQPCMTCGATGTILLGEPDYCGASCYRAARRAA